MKRFDVKTCMTQENRGKYVLYTDYALLESEFNELKNKHCVDDCVHDMVAKPSYNVSQCCKCGELEIL